MNGFPSGNCRCGLTDDRLKPAGPGAGLNLNAAGHELQTAGLAGRSTSLYHDIMSTC